MYCFICEDSIDGIFTGVYDAWSSRYGHQNLCLRCGEVFNYELGMEYIEVLPESKKSQSVARTIVKRCGREVYEEICQSILGTDFSRKKQLDKADCVYRTILLGFSMEHGERVLQMLGQPYVQRIFELSRSTYQEGHHLLGFLRFAELENGILFATIHPKNDVLSILGEHFSDRLPQENFLIYDENRSLAVVHSAGKNFFVIDASELNFEKTKHYSIEEAEYQKLWCGFFESIAILDRKNLKLQSQNIPKRFWKDTVELA